MAKPCPTHHRGLDQQQEAHCGRIIVGSSLRFARPAKEAPLPIFSIKPGRRAMTARG